MLTRNEAVRFARTWKGTPYITGGRVRGAGVDCATLLAEYLLGIGAAPEVPLFTYAQDWFLHTAQELYFAELSKYAACVWQGRCLGTPPAQPGDIALYRVARSKRFNHGGIVLDWPKALHAYDRGVSETRPGMHPLTARMEMALFSPWG